MEKTLPDEAVRGLHYNLNWEWRSERIENLRCPVQNSGNLKGVTYANGLIDQKLVTNDTSDYLWYMTRYYVVSVVFFEVQGTWARFCLVRK